MNDTNDNYAGGHRRPTITLREAASLLHAVGLVLGGTAALAREGRRVGGEWARHQARKHPRQGTNRKMETKILYRPVGQKERDLIAESDWKAFPPRLAHQPIFYPVLNEEYATQIARDWNTKDAASGFVGYVTRFAVRADWLSRYEVQVVGGIQHEEYWILAEDLPAFNAALVGPIEVIAEFRGGSNSA